MAKPRHAKKHVRQSGIYTSDKKARKHIASREHKDTIFRIIFRDRKKLLQLYNALNDSQYVDEQELTVTTLESVIYLSYKNDTSFLLDQVMFLGEHQASWNNNMPIRGLFYFARLYQDYIDARGYDLYGSKEIPLPFPMYVVFYNGLVEKPERTILKLSDALRRPEQYDVGKEWCEPAVECIATILNINYGRNKELLEKCQPLMEYAKFVYYVRKNQDDEMDIKMAVISAIDQCLKENILVKELTVYRKEVIDMFILEHYDEEFHRRKQREEIREEIEDEAREEAEKKIYKEMIKRRQEEEKKIQKDINKRRREEEEKIQKDINERRQEEEEKIQKDINKRRREEEEKIQKDINERRQAEEEKIQKDINKRRQEELERIHKDIDKMREEELERIHKDINKMREEELKRIHKEINEIREELKRNLESIPDSK